MKCAIMQPYLFPYLGYFQLIQAVNVYVVYDDVQYIKGGWINRNKILVRDQEHLFTFGIKTGSTFDNINQKSFSERFEEEKTKFLTTIKANYARAPFFRQVYPLIAEIMSSDELKVSPFITNSITMICKYLGIDTIIKISSHLNSPHLNELKGEERVIAINKILGAECYINAIGGTDLYSKANFENHSIELNFIKMAPIVYKQFNNKFIPNLSIIDVLMFNGVADIKLFLEQYELV
ncbi:WbqC family protein [Paenibacillus chartarius]|uniref:WbqC family protein n=1 Tax=Paenibacillus chartarius TaxID=747481 RepID=A0ABV6DF29_9BACL